MQCLLPTVCVTNSTLLSKLLVASTSSAENDYFKTVEEFDQETFRSHFRMNKGKTVKVYCLVSCKQYSN